MSKTKSDSEKDLFGHPIKKRIDPHEKLLAKIDKQTFAERVERLKFLESFNENFGMMGTFEIVFIFQEAGGCYINGLYISTILLAQAFIEHYLHNFMMERGLEHEANRGAYAIIQFCREQGLINEFLLAKFDRLRQIRNPFVHTKPYDHPYTLSRRIFDEKNQPEELLKNDAKEALSLMYTILYTRL